MISIEQGGLRWVLVGSYIKSIATMGWGPSLTIQSFLAAINYWRSPSGRMCKVMGSKITLPLCPEFQWVGDEFMTSSFTTPSDKVSRGSQANRIYLHASGGLTSKWRRERILTWLQGVSKKVVKWIMSPLITTKKECSAAKFSHEYHLGVFDPDLSFQETAKKYVL